MKIDVSYGDDLQVFYSSEAATLPLPPPPPQHTPHTHTDGYNEFEKLIQTNSTKPDVELWMKLTP